MKKIYELFSIPQHKGCYLGIEVELENVTKEVTKYDEVKYHKLTQNLVRCIKDGSLRNHGAEFIFNQPLMYGSREFEQSINYIEKTCSTLQAVSSPRTSTHYHLNVTDLTPSQLSNLMYMSLLIEPVLMKYCSEYRQHNRFCLPTWQSDVLHDLRNCLKWVAEGVADDAAYFSVDRTKYSSISLHRLSDLGTVEYRMFDGTYNSAVHRNIGKLLNFLRRISQHRTLEEIKEAKVQGRLRTVLTSVLRTAFGTKVSTKELQQLLDKGAVQANDLVRTDINQGKLRELKRKIDDLSNKLEQREDSERAEPEAESPEGSAPTTSWLQSATLNAQPPPLSNQPRSVEDDAQRVREARAIYDRDVQMFIAEQARLRQGSSRQTTHFPRPPGFTRDPNTGILRFTGGSVPSNDRQPDVEDSSEDSTTW
ncbi:amidoligase [Pseudoalteromonas phage RIO-1]|uniref:Amidoligase n=1 Tax=Pseudoalteromonas phage RIO-1 TaxID=1316739 RepID=R4JE08_9CAUD|nr:amidoligase enzyme [Pseudoalteromonas phage RIO-1]AGK87027.1 amidoligase [Pseudoalteromonas phage RIO-1]